MGTGGAVYCNLCVDEDHPPALVHHRGAECAGGVEARVEAARSGRELVPGRSGAVDR